MNKEFYILTLNGSVVTAIEEEEVEHFTDDSILDFSFCFKNKKEAEKAKKTNLNPDIKVNRVVVKEL